MLASPLDPLAMGMPVAARPSGERLLASPPCSRIFRRCGDRHMVHLAFRPLRPQLVRERLALRKVNRCPSLSGLTGSNRPACGTSSHKAERLKAR